MSRHLLLSLAILLALPLMVQPPAMQTQAVVQATRPVSTHEDYRRGAVLVKFKPGKAVLGRAALAAEGLVVTQEIGDLGVFDLAVPVGDESATAEQLSMRSDVLYAELDYRARAQIEPNDPNYQVGKQWGLTQVRAVQAWDVTTGASNVVIAVLDSGIDLVHPDFAGKLWTNKGEIANNGKDDDGNGCTDDSNGCRFYQAWNGTSYEPRVDGQVRDDNGHGTHVAGVAAAATNNGVGIAGLSWASPVMTVKVIDSFGNAWYSDIAKGILYAVANGASIINMSLGGATASETLCDAVTTATSDGKLVIAAAGNNDRDVYYPAMCPGALAVAASDHLDHAAAFSNPGSRLDLAAPGVDIMSTWYATGLNQSTYTTKSGTSESVPFVAGAAALVWARWPALTVEEVKEQLIGTVVDDTGMPGKDDKTGWGRLDVGAAVAARVQPVDLHLSVTVAPHAVIAGNPLTASFTVLNAGTSSATSVTLHASLPSIPTADAVKPTTGDCRLNGLQMICGVNRLDPGASLTVSAMITPTAVSGGELTTTATVNAAQRELTPVDNTQAVKSAIHPVLSGRVFVDANADGIRQGWESQGVDGAWLFLEQNSQPIAYANSHPPDGAYRFDMVAPGSYVLRAELPPGFLFTTPSELAVVIEPAGETLAYFGVRTGIAEPTPSPTPDDRPRLFLPFLLR